MVQRRTMRHRERTISVVRHGRFQYNGDALENNHVSLTEGDPRERRTITALVVVSDPAELNRIKVGFAKKKLGLSAEAADAGIKAAAAKMKGIRSKNRVTFYYLLAEATGTIDKLN
jgi:hypothetical protein